MTSHVIVYVDDEPALCRLFRLSTEKEESWEVVTFTMPHEALDYLRAHKVDALLCDFRMPGMTGVELLAALDGDGPDVVMISGDHGLQDHLKDPRVKKIIRKPFAYDELLAVVHELLKG